jgi:hypothetical protein
MWGRRPASCHVPRQLDVLLATDVGTDLIYDLGLDLDKNLTSIRERSSVRRVFCTKAV